ncbi:MULTISPECIES: tyrosine-type recombinase/integrase [Acinetobacter]|nr:site-specific integrase [Acinetobacter lwoffii]MCU4616760.1 site-specific integrase [Acinetobacter lwoffii]NKS46196.1 site-specific integrase [Acinetobacter lwoffii]QGR74054.1 site-specific integrase [Acinetobacter lwoffii]QKT99718.1 site-specific integrase [Acinetobacter lwoffii]TMS41546.1 site-specific integrase [Acinetobacter lwoffii]
MITIQSILIEYKSVDTLNDSQHFVLKAILPGDKEILLSHPNLFLYYETNRAINTSKRYANILAQFYSYLSTDEKFRDIEISKYHVLTDNRDIRKWQIYRQIKRVQKQSNKPTSKTIFEDAKIILHYFKWLHNSGYVTNVSIEHKNWIANFKNQRMLNYIQQTAKQVIDAKNIKVLDKERRQSSSKSLITNEEIKALINAYTDPAYSALFKLSLGTGMRPIELVQFPYLGNGENKHIMPYSEMDKDNPTIGFEVIGKGKKLRTVRINIKDLKELDNTYIKPFYNERRKLYREKYGIECPPSILFLNKVGKPITPTMISKRSNDAKLRAMKFYPDFREKITFYEARHWWPTMFALEFFKEKLLDSSSEVLYAAFAEALKNQMGHEDLETTYKYYIDMARLVYSAHQRTIHELLVSPQKTVQEMLDDMK